MEQAYGLAFGGLFASVHTIRILANRGLVSPNEVENIDSRIMEGVGMGGEDFQAQIEVALGGVFAEIRQYSKERWVGGENDPEKLG